jgi:S1-C subfamily serine protease
MVLNVPETPPPPARRGRRSIVIAAVVVICVLAAAAGIAWTRSDDGSTNASPRSSTSTAVGSTPTTVVSTPTTATKTLTMPQLQTAVDPAIVDITTQLGTTGAAAGTGMLIGSDGVILTNNHVISGATSISVHVHGASTGRPATPVGYDVSHDVAVLKVAGMTGAPTIAPETSRPVTFGEKVVVIGNALGKGGWPAVPGTVAGLDRTINASDAAGGDVETLTDVIELTANIEPGDSGGAVVDLYGHVIGMTTAGSSSGVQPVSTTTTGFAIPIARAMSIAQQIEAGDAGSTVHIGEHGLLGVAVVGSARRGVVVAGVEPNSPGAAAGLASGDTIVSANGTSIATTTDLNRVLQQTHVGDKIAVGYIDLNGQTRNVVVTLTSGAG